MLPQISNGLDRTLYTRFATLCTTLVAILSTDAMSTSIPTKRGMTYTTARFTTEHSLETNVCSRSPVPSAIPASPCRARSNKCDLPEYCTMDGYCPPGVHLADRTPCDFNDGVCYRGQCHLTYLPCGAFSTHTFPSELITSHTNIPSVPDVCSRHEICVDGRCLLISSIEHDACPTSEDGHTCSGHGHCTNENRCVCTCGWYGRACEARHVSGEGTGTIHWCIPEEEPGAAMFTTAATVAEESTRHLPAVKGDERDNDEISSTTFLANAIIGGSIALMFGIAVIFGATSIGFRKVRKKDRLRTMHQFRIMSIFQPTKAQQRKLNKQGGPHYTKGYRSRRKDHSKNKDHRIMLEPERNHHKHTKYKPPQKPRNHSIPVAGSSKILSETMV